MSKITEKELRKTALKLLPAIYSDAMQTGEESGLFQHEDWRTGLCLDAFLLADAFEKAAAYRNTEPKPQLKTLDQSVFSNMHERWKFAAVDEDGSAHRFSKEVFPFRGGFCYEGDEYHEFKFSLIGTGYDASNWQNSLIKRDDIAKKLAEVDLSIDLTGGELCLKLLNLDRNVMCDVKDGDYRLIFAHDGEFFISHNKGERECHKRVIPINNQGEPLTASEVGL